MAISTLDLSDQLAEHFTQYATGTGFTHAETELVNGIAVISFRRPGGAPLTNDVLTLYIEPRTRSRQVAADWEIDSPSMKKLQGGLEGYASDSFRERVQVVKYGDSPRIRPFEFKPISVEDAAAFCEGVYLPRAEDFFQNFSTVDAIERAARDNFEQPPIPGESKKNVLIERFILYCLTIGDYERADRANRDLVESGQDQNFDFQGYLNNAFPGRLSSVAV